MFIPCEETQTGTLGRGLMGVVNLGKAEWGADGHPLSGGKSMTLYQVGKVGRISVL